MTDTRILLGNWIYLANGEARKNIEIKSLIFSESQKIKINGFYIYQNMNRITEVKESGYFHEEWRLFSTEKQAQKYHTKEKIKILKEKINLLKEEINNLTNENNK